MRDIRFWVKKKFNRKQKKLIRISITMIFFFICAMPFVFTCKFVSNKVSASKVSKVNMSNKTILEERKKTIICIDPGHGGYDKGTESATGILEKNITLDVALKLGDILEKNNFKVVYTRNNDEVSWSSDEKLDLRERVKISKEANADIFVSIHCNGNPNKSFSGIETWCRFSDSEDEKLAKSIQQELMKLNYTSSRGLKYEKDKSLAVLKLNESIAVLVELGFLTNSSDAKFITSEKGKEKLAQAIADGIISSEISLIGKQESQK